MTLDENLNLLNDTKKRIKASLDNKVPQSTDNKSFGEYHTIVDGFEHFSTNIDDYTITDCVKFSDITDTSIINVKQYIKSVNIPTTVTSLGSWCFQYCSGLTSVTIPESVTSLGSFCFNSCSSLTGITIPDSVTSIDVYCFNGCSSLSTVTIGNSVTSIGSTCFQSCSSLTSVTCKATTPPTLGGSAFFDTPSTMVIYVPASSVSAYKSSTNWSSYADKIQAITS